MTLPGGRISVALGTDANPTRPWTSLKRTPIQIENGQVEVRIGDAHASAPLEMLEPLIQLLEASALYIKATPAPAPAPPAPKRETAQQAPVAPAPEEAPRAYQRKSRKPVAQALTAWMEANPGWKGEKALLAAVVDNGMTDADPKRALMIALGKARGKTFDTDGRGHWKLTGDDAGPAPRRNATLKAKSSSSKAKKSRAARTKKKTTTTKITAKKKKRGRKTKVPAKKGVGAALVDWMTLNPGWRTVDELLEAVVDHKVTAANPNLALRIALGKGAGSGAFVNEGDRWSLASDTTQADDGASNQRESSKKSKGGAAGKGAKRWRKPDGKAVDRARKNLLGLSKPLNEAE